MNPTDLTIVIPTRNETANIARCLRAIPPGIQVILVDASTDQTGDIARRTRADHLEVVRDAGNIPRARQIGADLARTEWILYSDADVELAPDYVARLSQIDTDAEQGAVIGAKLSRGRYQRYYRWFSGWIDLLSRIGVPAGSGSNLLVRRTALRLVGGFDTDLSCNEDSELVWRLRRHGYRVSYASSLRVFEFDHRRLDAGIWRKTLHSLTRCALIDAGLLGVRGKRSDWGYWAAPTSRRRRVAGRRFRDRWRGRSRGWRPQGEG